LLLLIKIYMKLAVIFMEELVEMGLLLLILKCYLEMRKIKLNFI